MRNQYPEKEGEIIFCFWYFIRLYILVEFVNRLEKRQKKRNKKEEKKRICNYSELQENEDLYLVICGSEVIWVERFIVQ